MDIPVWFAWIALPLFLLQVLGLFTVIDRLRGSDAALRAKARLDLLDVVGAMLLFGGMILALLVAESWAWLSLPGFALMSASYAVKGVRRLRARRRSTA
ncbi:hypothetical protein [Streptomyces sp. ID05-47C]|uniref:hypothetical protein n=1 Tax=Streptomyces sp. ID05-47C TaxID=3028665 RepID=UPI0029BB1619|nr:hypothetical protein [Streptomyces sp. ID05-47C]MDX3571338.1 hypothetical protein [Streptomyces sp. ID05-47C]